ncbi:MAG TPA: glycosyltransferase family 39 protein [Myxococcaceae bacterium]|nr:glycosyltransferase family 39 protein [Myxococcaceae bacterium]
MDTHPAADGPPGGARLAALLVVAAVLFSGLGSVAGGSHPDEGLYLEAGREMHARGDWLTPTVDGRPDFTKPPLLYWAMGASFSLLGTSLLAARLPVALAALALAWVTGRLARRALGAAAEPVAILLLGTCLGLLRYARVDLMDVPLALAIAVGLGALWRVASGGPPALALVAGVAAAAAALLKGPVGPLLMVVPGLGYLARRGLLRSRLPWLLGAAALALALAAPWYVAMAHQHGVAFVGRFFGTENVGKFQFPWTLQGELELLLALPVLLLPWTPLVRPRGPAFALAWPWVVWLLLLYSLPGLKHPHYVVPALAPLVLLACGPPEGRRRWTSAALLLGLAVSGALALRFPLPGSARLGLAGAVVLVALGAVAVSRGALRAGATGLAGAAVLLFATVLPRAVPPPIPPWVATTAAGRPLFTATQNPGLYTFLVGTPVHRVSGADGVLRALEAGQALLVTGEERALLPPAVLPRLRPLASWPRLRGRLTVREVVAAWWRADVSGLLEPMSLEVLTPAPPV